jgi:hypothetical protein
MSNTVLAPELTSVYKSLPNMDDNHNYVAIRSAESISRDANAFGAVSRFNSTPSGQLLDDAWAQQELIPILKCAYTHLPHVGEDYNWQRTLHWAELLEPWHLVGYRSSYLCSLKLTL